MKRTPVQRAVLKALEKPGAYLSCWNWGTQWQVIGTPLIRNGHKFDWTIPRRTLECLKAAGLIVYGKREAHSRNQVGYFLKRVTSGEPSTPKPTQDAPEEKGNS